MDHIISPGRIDEMRIGIVHWGQVRFFCINDDHIGPFTVFQRAGDITNANLDKSSATLVARLGQAGLAKVISPVHTIYDGDIVFTLASGEIDADPISVGVLAEEALMEATARAVTQAEGLGGVPSCSTLSLTLG